MTTRIHLARTGRFRDNRSRTVTIDAATLNELADGYDPANFKAPLVLGHPADGAPAYGWVERLTVNGDNLYGEVSDVAPELTEAVKAGHYRNVSISYWPKGDQNSPAKDRSALRHVGILGAQAPAIKGLEPLGFDAGDDGYVTIEFADTEFGFRVMRDLFRNVREWIIGTAGQEEADRIAPTYMIDNLDAVADSAGDAPRAFEDPSKPHHTPLKTTVEDTPMSGTEPKTTDQATELAEREAALAEREAAIAAKEADAAKAEAAARSSAAIAFADGLIKDGKLAPAAKPVIVDIHRRLAASDEPVQFSDGTSKPVLGEFEALLAGASPIIDLSEHTKDDGAATLEADATATDLSARALEIQKGNPALSFSEAVRQAEGETKQ